MTIKEFYRFVKSQKLVLDYPVHFKPRYQKEKPHAQLFEIINRERQQYEQLLSEAVTCKQVFQSIRKNNEEKFVNMPTYNNGYLPGLDIIGIYTILKHYEPEQYVEVGSGYSTKVAYQSIQDNHLQTKIISIDPQPRDEIDMLVDTLIRKPFEEIDYSMIFTLKENDILFIDNSHRILPNSDAMVFFMEILPQLPKGVIVHIHDIYLPYDYPQFMCDRFYSEQYGLAAYLLANPERYVPIMANYFISEDETLKSILNPIWEHPNLEGVERHGGSFWLQIR
ncbi:MAG: class I SAM-dependent methyltransferase [Bacteroidales bacterium]|nr:class I SAM-dependent methyltransferase [Bacteroidales bacterium]